VSSDPEQSKASKTKHGKDDGVGVVVVEGSVVIVDLIGMMLKIAWSKLSWM
jgi:hypothetical protein